MEEKLAHLAEEEYQHGNTSTIIRQDIDSRESSLSYISPPYPSPQQGYSGASNQSDQSAPATWYEAFGNSLLGVDMEQVQLPKTT